MAYFISASLFPSLVTPYTGLFVMHRLNALRQVLPENTPLSIVSPTPYFPFKHKIFGRYGIYAQKPTEVINYQDFEIAYPRYWQIPFTNNAFSGKCTYGAIRPYFMEFVKKYGQPKKLIAEYGFPDAIAIYHLSQEFNIPYVVTVRGSDISYFLKLKTAQPQLLQALMNAEAIISVSKDLKTNLYQDYHIPADKIHVIGNGVSSEIFKYTPSDFRKRYDIQHPKLIASVGGLVPRKNHILAIQALAHLPNYALVIAGEGPQLKILHQEAIRLNILERVFFIGNVPQKTLAELYSAADLFLLCSHSEGRPNVVLEALACGTPVLSSDVQGISELIFADDYGKFTKMSKVTPKFISEKIIEFEIKNFSRDNIQAHGHSFSWQNSASEYCNILQK